MIKFISKKIITLCLLMIMAQPALSEEKMSQSRKITEAIMAQSQEDRDAVKNLSKRMIDTHKKLSTLDPKSKEYNEVYGEYLQITSEMSKAQSALYKDAIPSISKMSKITENADANEKCIDSKLGADENKKIMGALMKNLSFYMALSKKAQAMCDTKSVSEIKSFLDAETLSKLRSDLSKRQLNAVLSCSKETGQDIVANPCDI